MKFTKQLYYVHPNSTSLTQVTTAMPHVLKELTLVYEHYDTMAVYFLTWTRKLSIQLNLAHVARKKYKI